MIADWYEDRRLRLLSEEAVGTRILDLGYAQLPNRYLIGPDRHVTGIDLALGSGGSGYDVEIQADVMDLDLSGPKFTTVVAGELIEHLERPFDFVRKLKGLLEPGGRLILSTPNPLGFPMAFFEYVNSRRRFYSGDHTICYTPRWMTRLLETCGFSVEATRSVGLWNPLIPVHWCPVTFSYQVIYVAHVA